MILLLRRRLLCVLLAVPLLAAPSLGALTLREAPREVRSAPPVIEVLVSQVWSHLLEVWEKAGSSTDPFGLSSPNAAPSPPGTISVQGAPPASGK
jgi:hypothetical protein